MTLRINWCPQCKHFAHKANLCSERSYDGDSNELSCDCTYSSEIKYSRQGKSIQEGERCPCCDEGVLQFFIGDAPTYLRLPVYECTECGDLVGSEI